MTNDTRDETPEDIAVPLTMTAEREALVRSGNLWVGNTHTELLAELDATRAALATVREELRASREHVAALVKVMKLHELDDAEED